MLETFKSFELMQQAYWALAVIASVIFVIQGIMTFSGMEAEARGLNEVLTKQAAGYDKMIQAAGGDATKAYTLLLLEKLPELVKTQVEAIKGINIDKVTVWDGGQGADGKGSTASFVSNLYKAVPPLQDLFDQVGMKLPEYLGKEKASDNAPEAETEE